MSLKYSDFLVKDKYYNVIENTPTASELWGCQRDTIIISNLAGHMDIDLLENNDWLRSFQNTFIGLFLDERNPF